MNYYLIAPGLISICLLMSSGCKAQRDPKDKNYTIAQKDGSLKDYCVPHKIELEKLKAFNPRLMGDVVHKGDTVFISQSSTQPKKMKKDDYNEKAVGNKRLFKRVTLNDKDYLVLEVDPHQYKIEAFNRQKKGGVYNFTTLAKEKKDELIFLMNGGMFEKDLTPLGLFISEGTIYNKLNLRKDAGGNFYDLPPNGVFLIDSNENPVIIESKLYSEKYRPRMATQSGPMLVINGQYNPNFKEESDNVNIRNGVGVNKKNMVVFVIANEPINFYEFARLFKEKLGCDNALYLDGVVSQSYAPELDRSPNQYSELGVFITVSQRVKTNMEKSNEPLTQPKGITPQNGKKPKAVLPPKQGTR